MHTVPRHLTPDVDPSWLYRLPTDYLEPVDESREDPELDVLLDLAAERLGLTV